MHYHMEIIMPPSKDIKKDIETILAPFDENHDAEEQTGNEFFDFFVIGGRWAGTKESCRYDADKLAQFYKELNEKKVTVSGLQCGKQTLSPESQIPMVDKMWNDFFPTENGEITPCPIFSHSNNQYDSNDLLACDICRVDEIPENLTCSRIIFAGPNWDDSKIKATFMLCDEQWNGVNHMKIDWDQNVKNSVEKCAARFSRYKDEYREKVTPKPDWICVTVDYHS